MARTMRRLLSNRLLMSHTYPQQNERGARMAIRYFAIAAGLVYVLIGLMGFVPGINVEGPPDAPDLAVDGFYGYLLGLFPVNVLHNLVHLAFGVAGLVFARSAATAKAYLLWGGAAYAVLWLYGLVVGGCGGGPLLAGVGTVFIAGVLAAGGMWSLVYRAAALR